MRRGYVAVCFPPHRDALQTRRRRSCASRKSLQSQAVQLSDSEGPSPEFQRGLGRKERFRGRQAWPRPKWKSGLASRPPSQRPYRCTALVLTRVISESNLATPVTPWQTAGLATISEGGHKLRPVRKIDVGCHVLTTGVRFCHGAGEGIRTLDVQLGKPLRMRSNALSARHLYSRQPVGDRLGAGRLAGSGRGYHPHERAGFSSGGVRRHGEAMSKHRRITSAQILWPAAPG